MEKLESKRCLTVLMPDALITKALAKTKAEDRSLSQKVREWVEAYLEGRLFIKPRVQ